MLCIIQTPDSNQPLAKAKVANELKAWEEIAKYLGEYPLAWFDLVDETDEHDDIESEVATKAQTRNIGWVKEGYEYLEHWT